MSHKIQLRYLNVNPETGVLFSDHSYWIAFNVKDVLESIQSQAGKKCDPRVVENFIVMITFQY